MMAELFPRLPTLEGEIADAWHEGMSPQTNIDALLKEAQSQVARGAADKRHLKNRQAKERALELYFSCEYASVDVAASIISEQVFKAPRTISRWISEAREVRALEWCTARPVRARSRDRSAHCIRCSIAPIF